MPGDAAAGRVRLPQSGHIDELRSTLDAGLRVLAQDLGLWLAAECRQRGVRLESAWATFAERGRYRFRAQDPADLLLLLSKPVPELVALRIPLHLRRQIYEAKRIRNQLYHHAFDALTPDDTALLLQPLQRIAAALDLAAHEEITALRSAVLRLTEAPPETSSPMELAKELGEARAALARRTAEEAELLEHRDRLEAALREAHERLAAGDHQETPARDRAGAGAEAATVSELQRSIEHLDAVHRERAATVETALAIEHLRRIRLQRALNAETGNSVAEDDADTDASEAGFTMGGTFDHGLLPGAPWPYPRGDLVLILSSQPRDLLRSDGSSLLTSETPVVLLHAVEALLHVRPEGGRVWVDDDGDTCTFRDGELIHLGRLPVDLVNRELAAATSSPSRSLPFARPALSVEAVLEWMRSIADPQQ